ncbi:TetR/AcrR family transcriptional regulator [bacterium]|nr:TetR/AcrR family transcriptional regulator [bacterium]MBU1882796.1 TetR/AcrR family transcriptional regulator [bacterium]
MAIIVDKVQKRKDIALTCKELFVQNGMKDLTISQIAVTAGVGKGTLYDYFTNKEDIVFEIVNILMQEHNALKDKKMANAVSTKGKIKHFFDFFYNREEIELRELYKELISISLAEPSKQMKEFQTRCHVEYNRWFTEILEEGIQKGEIIEDAKKLVNGFMAVGEGLFISSCVTEAIDDLEHEINSYIDTIFDLIEVKK